LTSTAKNQVNTTNFGSINVVYDPEGEFFIDGLDLSADYAFKTDSVGAFDVGVTSNVLFNYEWRGTANSPYFQYARIFTDSTYGLGGYEGLLPGYVVKPFANYSYKAVSASIFMTYYPKVTAPGDLFAGQSAVDDETLNGKPYKIPSYFTADASVSYTLPNLGYAWLRKTTVTAGANNVFNKAAPYVPGDGSSVAENNTDKGAYDIIGRFWFVELKKAF